MSVIQEQRNELQNRFRDQAVILVEDALYSVDKLSPNAQNERLFPVHEEAVERLNSTMTRHIAGNSQIFVTMLYKDVPREECISKFWNGLIEQPEFKKLPARLQALELEQARKLGPTSRYTIEKLFDGFINHIDKGAKVLNTHRDDWEEALEPFSDYIAESIKIARLRYPKETEKYFERFYDLQSAYDNLNKDKSGGDPYFIRVDRPIAGAVANDLYLKGAKLVKSRPEKEVYYEMFIRVQPKGNNIIKDLSPVDLTKVDKTDMWLAEKNRVVQGDSRSWQFVLKNMSDIITKIPKMVDPIFAGWDNQEVKNEVIGNTMKEFHGKYLFDSFDATDYDASTDPYNFAMGIRLLYRVLEKVGLRPNSIVDLKYTIRHYLNDATLTPWGAYHRDSTPSGHNFTGPNGTLTNQFRMYVQTKRLFKCTYEELNSKLRHYREKRIALFLAVGDDATQLRDKTWGPQDVAEENNSDGFKQGDLTKLVLDADYIHYLQFGYYYDGQTSLFGYYPVSRIMEHCLWQEKADQYTAESVSTQAAVQNLNNARFNPLQDYAIDFLMEGDTKYRLGSEIGVVNLFKLASGGRTVAETLGREWDPAYEGMTWEQYSEVIRDTARKIESRRGKFPTSNKK